MSPEQLAGNADLIDTRSDIYSLGRVLQEMLSESPQAPLAATGHAQSLVAPIKAQVSQLQSANQQAVLAIQASHDEVKYAANVPAELIAVCEKATAADPAARYAQVQDFRNALQAWLSPQLPKPSRRRRNMLAASLVVIVGAAAATLTQREPIKAPEAAVVVIPDDLPSSVELMLRCPPHVFRTIVERWRDELPQIVALLREQLTEILPTKETSLLDLERRHAAALALLKLGHENDYWSIWRAESDPRPITIQLAQFGRDELTAARFIDRLRTSQHIQPITSLPANYIARLFRQSYSERRNLLLALATGKGNLSKCCDKEFLNEISKLYQLDADPCVHVLTEKILRHANVPLPQLDRSAQEPAADRGWYTNALGGSMVIVDSNPSVPYRFSIASCELQQQEFEQFIKETGYAWTGNRGSDVAANGSVNGQRAQAGLSWYDCAAFCNWLSRREGLEECYVPNADGKYEEGMSIKLDVRSLNGYRIPTLAEWITAARAGAFANVYFGHAPFAKNDYLWDASNGHGAAQPVAQLRPNNLGLFDVHGNVSEWTMDLNSDTDLPGRVDNGLRFVHLGGSAQTSDLADFEFDRLVHASVYDRSQLTGLRIARSLIEK